MSDTVVPFLDLAPAIAECRPELDEAYARVLGSSRFVLGPELEAFEHEFAELHGVRHCVGVASGLDALVLALRALDIGAGDEVIVPGMTFIATWLAVSQVGAIPVPVDVDETANIGVGAIEAAVTARTRAVIPVHLYGQPAAMDAIAGLAAYKDMYVVEDAAQAHLAAWDGRPVGSWGDIAAFSFYPGKNLGAFGDGGAVVTKHAELAERVRLLRNYGSPARYEHTEQGVNSRLDELQAAFLRVKLRHLPAWNQRRAEVAGRYLAALPELGLGAPVVAERASHAWHLATVWSERRDDLQRELAARGVQAQVHYPQAPHQTPAYAAFAGLSLPVSERVARITLSLPIGPHMDDDQVGLVLAALAASA